MVKTKGAATQRREQIRSEGEKGWFRAPRTLPLILVLLSSKRISGKLDPTRVYLELLACHRDSAIIDMVSEGEHSYSAGYSGSRGIRTWQERMKTLEQIGFIRSKSAGNTKYKYVLLVHPSIAVKRLYDAKKIDNTWWDSYRARQIESKETMFESLLPEKTSTKVVPIKVAKLNSASTRSVGK